MIDRLTSSNEVVGRRIKRAVGATACAVMTGTIGAIFMNSIGQTETTLGPATVDVGFEMNGNPHDLFGFNGKTKVGAEDETATFDTHSVGLSVDATTKSFDFKSIIDAVGPTVTTGQLDQTMRRQVSRDIDQLEAKKFEIGARSLGAFALGTVGAAALLQLLLWSELRGKGDTSLREILTNSVSVGAGSALLIGVTGGALVAATFDPSQFTSPQKSGAIATAEMLTKSSDTIRIADERNANTAVAVLSFINSIEAEAKLEEGIRKPAFQIVFIGDDHMVSPVGLVSGELQQSDIPSVLFDGGDYTNLGTGPENVEVQKWYQLLEALKKYSVPGNHDTQQSVEALKDVPNTTIVDKGELADWNVNGLRVLAIGDPLYTPNHSTSLSDEDAATIEALRERISQQIKDASEQDRPYDIVFTHEPSLLDDLDLGEANIMVSHTHSQETSFEGGRWSSNPGSTGGAGLRRFQGVTRDSENEETPRSYTVLSFDQSCQLIDVKEVSFQGTSSNDKYSVEKMINPDYDPDNDSTRCAA